VNARLEFNVDSVEPSGQVLGRNDDLDIPLGTTFTQIRKTRVDGDLMNLHSVELGVVDSIALTLVAVDFYRHSVDVVPGRCTAGLTLDGVGLGALSRALQGAADREFISIAAPLPNHAIQPTRGSKAN